MNHLKQITAKLDEYGLDAMLLSSEPGEFYAIGFHGEGLVVAAKNGCCYFTDSRYIESAEKNVTGAEITMTTTAVPHKALAIKAIEELGIKKLGFEEGYMTVSTFNDYTKDFPCELVPAQKLVGDLRASKDEGEIALMKKAQEITDAAFAKICKFIRPGMTEREIAARLGLTVSNIDTRTHRAIEKLRKKLKEWG